MAGILNSALAGDRIHRYKAELGGIALHPFKIIAVAPVIISLEGKTGGTDGLQVVVKVSTAEPVIIVAGAVFRDPQGAGQNFLQFASIY